MPYVLMTFDLEDAADDADAYEKGYEALTRAGLSRLSESKKLRLPYSTVMGDTKVGETASAIRDALKDLLEQASEKKVGRMLVGIVTDWACWGDKDESMILREAVLALTNALES